MLPPDTTALKCELTFESYIKEMKPDTSEILVVKIYWSL